MVDIEEFKKRFGVRFVNDPRTFNPVSVVYETARKQSLAPPNVDDFVKELNSRFAAGDRLAKIRDSRQILSDSPGRGLDALSKYLIARGATREQYLEIMGSAHNGYIDEHHKIEAEKLKS